MIKFNKEDRFYYQKKGLFYFLCLLAIGALCFKLGLGLDFYYAGVLIDLIVFLIGGPIAFVFVGSKNILVALPYILAPLPFLFLVKTERHFKIFIGAFLVYWICWGVGHFCAYLYF